jgi:hypothetical protein
MEKNDDELGTAMGGLHGCKSLCELMQLAYPPVADSPLRDCCLIRGIGCFHFQRAIELGKLSSNCSRLNQKPIDHK